MFCICHPSVKLIPLLINFNDLASIFSYVCFDFILFTFCQCFFKRSYVFDNSFKYAFTYALSPTQYKKAKNEKKKITHQALSANIPIGFAYWLYHY